MKKDTIVFLGIVGVLLGLMMLVIIILIKLSVMM